MPDDLQTQNKPNLFVLLAVLVGLPLAQAGLAPGIIDGATEAFGRPWFAFFGWIVVAEWALVALVAWSLRKRALTFKDFGWPEVGRKDLLIVGVLAFAMVAYIVWVGDSTSARIVDGPWILPRTREEKLFMLVAAFTAGICEELLYRGYLYGSLRALRIPRGAALMLALVSFALIHGPQQALPLLLLRLAAAVVFFGLYFWRGNLRAAIYVHMLADAQLALST